MQGINKEFYNLAVAIKDQVCAFSDNNKIEEFGGWDEYTEETKNKILAQFDNTTTSNCESDGYLATGLRFIEGKVNLVFFGWKKEIEILKKYPRTFMYYDICMEHLLDKNVEIINKTEKGYIKDNIIIPRTRELIKFLSSIETELFTK